MFNKENFEKIGEDIYVYHNFISDDLCDEVFNACQSLTNNQWSMFGPVNRYISTTRVTEKMDEIRSKMVELVHSGYYLGEALGIQKMINGSHMFPHSDNYESLDVLKANSVYQEGTDFELAKSNRIGLVLYLNDFKGGELEYVKQKIKFHPVKGDLVAHSSEEHCAHAVNELLSDIRYAYANNIYELIKIPKGYKREL
jgi:hypothetical protein